MEYLYEKLEAYGKSDYYGFHMPGHKRNSDVTRANFTIMELILQRLKDLIIFIMRRRSSGKRKSGQRPCIMQRRRTILINGSTAGILSAVMGCTKKGGKILMARNCHKSVYHAVF